MTYIWNRPDRVPEELKPDRITTCFNHWNNQQQYKLKKATDLKVKRNLRNKINKQTIAYEDAINSIYQKDFIHPSK